MVGVWSGFITFKNLAACSFLFTPLCTHTYMLPCVIYVAINRAVNMNIREKWDTTLVGENNHHYHSKKFNFLYAIILRVKIAGNECDFSDYCGQNHASQQDLIMTAKIHASNFDVSPVFSWTLESWFHGHYRSKRNIQGKVVVMEQAPNL